MLTALALSFPAGLCATDPTAPKVRPNIIVILADDIGYGDLSCYGAKLVQTPNLDRLASEGRRFSDAHSPAASCTPSRRALLTGRYSWRQPEGAHIAPGDEAITIKPGTFTLPEMLKRSGYKTGIVGKWHLGLGNEGGPDWNGEIKPSPLDLGFDHSFIMAATGDRVPTVYIEDRHVVGLDPADPIRVSYRAKIGDEPTGAEHPELLKLKHTHGHDMTIVNGVGRIGWMTGGRSARWTDEDMADTFTKKAVEFLEREKDRPFFLYFATHNIHVPRVPNPRHLGRSQCGTRGDAIVELDESVGALMATLERLKLVENTLVIFSSDNGGIMDDGYEDVGNFDHPCNGTLRGYKGSLFEGGHRVPFIARWPGRIQPGTVCPQLTDFADFLPTAAELSGAPVRSGIDGVSILPSLLGQTAGQQQRPYHYWEFYEQGGRRALRQGDWKAIIQPWDGNLELYDLANDIGETNNLATQRPEIAGRMRRLIDEAHRPDPNWKEPGRWPVQTTP
ncbi:MAG: arylsulfatase [Verrucomicrobiae bacterium]|nr:arylsulfatase [Verrucomicrobiae bacterium]